MRKFHISEDGVIRICKAKDRPCPLGGPDEHYTNILDAKVALEKKMSKEYGHLAPSPEEVAEQQRKGELSSKLRKISHNMEGNRYIQDEIGFLIGRIHKENISNIEVVKELRELTHQIEGDRFSVEEIWNLIDNTDTSK